MRESDIAYEAPNGRAWVLKDTKRKPRSYTVMIVGVTHSTSDSAYSFDEDGLSIAKARADYLDKPERKIKGMKP